MAYIVEIQEEILAAISNLKKYGHNPTILTFNEITKNLITNIDLISIYGLTVIIDNTIENGTFYIS